MITNEQFASKKFNFKKLFKYIFLTILAFIIFLFIYVFTVIANTPKIDTSHLYDYLAESTTILDDEGNLVNNIYAADGGNRENIDYKDMPQNLVNAVVSIEDKTFWTHNGFNFWRMAGSVVNSIFSGDRISGTSTITQQLSRNIFLSEKKSERSLNRKISEAYYTIILEANLDKEQILEAYLNTIYLGNNSYGVEAAAKSYFNKDAKDLTLIECASLAALPQAPDSYALVKQRASTEGTSGLQENQPIVYEDADNIYYYNGEVSKSRRDTTLKLMRENGYISQADYDSAISGKLLDCISVNPNASNGSSYFTDYLIDEVASDLMEKYNITEQEAKNQIYTGGLKVYSTLNKQAQDAVEEGFAQTDLFPSISDINYDDAYNIVTSSGDIMLYAYDNYFDENGTFTLTPDEYKIKNGNLVLLKNKRLKFYKTTVNGEIDYSVEFNSMYDFINGVLYSLEGGTILIPQEYKTLDKDGNLVIDKAFFKDTTVNANFLKKSGDDYTIPSSCYQLKSFVRQPQAAMVITDYTNGQVKAMVGGRDTTGQMLYNRATNLRQPGSAIKPLSVYSSALQQSKEAVDNDETMYFEDFDEDENSKYYGKYWTMASYINDEPIDEDGKDWPVNWYDEYRGEMSMVEAVEQSVNTCAVRVYRQIGSQYAVKQLKKFGITSVVEEGETNDMNAAALALGGMSKGISPLEMSAAFGVFPNGGTRVETVAYTKVVDKNGKTILATNPKETKVIDKGVAYITRKILESVVNNGLATDAKVAGKATGGKTGTTSNYFDLWFCGFTPQYSAAIWIGNDVNLSLYTSTSYRSTTTLFAYIMNRATAGMDGEFPSKPSNVVESDGDYFIRGTEDGVRRAPTTKTEKAVEKVEKKVEELEQEIKEVVDDNDKSEDNDKKENEDKKENDNSSTNTQTQNNSQATNTSSNPSN